MKKERKTDKKDGVKVTIVSRSEVAAHENEPRLAVPSCHGRSMIEQTPIK